MTVLDCRHCDEQTWVSDGFAAGFMDMTGLGATYICRECGEARENSGEDDR